MELLQDKNGIIMGVANERSLATAIAKQAHQAGARVGFSHLPDPQGKMLARVQRAVGVLDPFIMEPCDVNQDEHLESFFAKVKDKCQHLDFLVHSIAFAPAAEIRGRTLDVSRQGFLQAMESSVYSFIAAVKAAEPLLKDGASVITLSYFGSEKVIPGYNLMGVAKAALEAGVRYLAKDLGQRNIRVNAISAGTVKTLASSAVGDFGKVLSASARLSPLNRNVSGPDIGKASLFLLSSMGSGVTGETLHVDTGCNIMGYSQE